MQKVIEIAKFYSVLRLYILEYFWKNYYWGTQFFQQIKKSWIYQTILSRSVGACVAEKQNKSLRLQYVHEGNLYDVWIPFEKRLVSKMLNQSVKLEFEDRDEILHQQPGVPYLICPRHIGASRAIITAFNKETFIGTNHKIHNY
jgi:hypothetical protein